MGVARWLISYHSWLLQGWLGRGKEVRVEFIDRYRVRMKDPAQALR